MDLDQSTGFHTHDSHNLLLTLDSAPQSLMKGWDACRSQDLPSLQGINKVAISARGEAALAAEVAVSCFGGLSPLGLHLLADENLPAWLDGEDTLLVGMNVDNTFRQNSNASRTVVIPSAGTDNGGIYADVGSLSSMLFRLGLAPNAQQELAEAGRNMETQADTIRANVEVCHNPAKRLAGQFMQRGVTLVAAEHLVPAARRWKIQINTWARAMAALEILPSPAGTNAPGTYQPEAMLDHVMSLFFFSSLYHTGNQARIEGLRMAHMEDGINTDVFTPVSGPRIAECLTALHLGDFCAFYLAMLYDYDPSETNG